MSPIQRILWWFEGKVAEMIVKEYEDPSDALLFPVVSAVMAVVFVRSALELPPHLSGWTAVPFVLLGFVGLLFCYTFVLSTAASVTYYREVTEVGAVVVE